MALAAARRNRSNGQSNHVSRNIGSRGRKSILLQSDKQHDCLIFRASDRIRGGNSWDGFWGFRVPTPSRVMTSSRRATRSPLFLSFPPAWGPPPAGARGLGPPPPPPSPHSP